MQHNGFYAVKLYNTGKTKQTIDSMPAKLNKQERDQISKSRHTKQKYTGTKQLRNKCTGTEKQKKQTKHKEIPLTLPQKKNKVLKYFFLFL